MTRSILLFLLACAAPASAVVIRDDVPDIRYRMPASEFPALADLPGEGHGVLVASQWVLTAAHAVSWQPSVDVVVVAGTPRAVQQVVIHPGYKKPPQTMIDAALKSGDWESFFEFLESIDDIALIQLADPIPDVAPVPIYKGSALGKIIRIMGRGATGTGAKGHPLQGPNRTDLRHGYNRITVSAGRWIGYRFDEPPKALPLEASIGSGDSGGPILVAVGATWHLAGINAWKRGLVIGNAVHPGRYGETSYGLRLAHYANWIEQTIAADTAIAELR